MTQSAAVQQRGAAFCRLQTARNVLYNTSADQLARLDTLSLGRGPAADRFQY